MLAGSTIKIQLPFSVTGTALRSATITVTAPDGEKAVDAAPMTEVSGFFEYDFTALDSYRGKYYVLATAIIGSKPYRRDGWITILPPQR